MASQLRWEIVGNDTGPAALVVLNAKRLLIALLLAGSLSARAERFVAVNSVITVTNNQAATSANNPWSFHVTCIVGLNKWGMTAQVNTNMREETYYDGTNVYDSIVPTGPSNDADTHPPGGLVVLSQRPANMPHASIVIKPSPGGHPLGNLCANMPWLAFCSGSYLKRSDRIVPLPVTASTSETQDSFAYLDKTEVFNDVFGLPKTLELYTSKSQYRHSLYDQRLLRTKHVLDARLDPTFPVPDGVLRFRYSVGESTNFQGWTFPLDFTFAKFGIDSAGNTVLEATGGGMTQSIDESGPPHNVFEPGAVQTVIDDRFRHSTKLVDNIFYTWTNGTVPSTDDPVLQSKFAEKVGRAGEERHLSLLPIRIMIFSVVLLIPAVFLIVKYTIRLRNRGNPDALSTP